MLAIYSGVFNKAQKKLFSLSQWVQAKKGWVDSPFFLNHAEVFQYAVTLFSSSLQKDRGTKPDVQVSKSGWAGGTTPSNAMPQPSSSKLSDAEMCDGECGLPQQHPNIKPQVDQLHSFLTFSQTS